MATTWWKNAVVYQIYPRSFCDSNDDGIGDLPGITSRLDYLQQLGVDVVWLSPVYRSPNDDNGYDISDYRDIMEEFGTMADFDAMLAAMHARGIRLMMDLVVNHTSDEHLWFQQARSSRDNPFHDYYIWREPREGREPNNWEAAFHGSCWEWNEATGEYYLHMFSKKQPDLNWDNPKVRAEIYDMMHFWQRKGVDGFRMDVINMISKPAGLPDAPVVRPGFLQPGFGMVTNGPRLLDYLREMRREVLSHVDGITVGEAPMATIHQGLELTHATDGALNMLFQFEHMDLDSEPGHANGKWAMTPLDLRDLKATMSRWQDALHGQGWNSLYLSNHDQPRPVSRFGDDRRYRVESAKMLGTWLHMLQGTPYIYQGEELGMTNMPFASLAEVRDIESINMYSVAVFERGEDAGQVLAAIRAKGRDNARTPVQWDDTPNAGFTSGRPWIGVNPNYPEVNARRAQADADSVFHHYRRLIALRQQHPVIVEGRHALLLPDHPQIYAYTRTLGAQRLLVVCNFSDKTPRFDWPAELADDRKSLLIGNLPVEPEAPPQGFSLRPYEARVYLCEKKSPASGARLLADVGGTNARFGWQDGPGAPIGDVMVLPCAEYETLAEAITTYLGRLGRGTPRACGIAIANPVTGDQIRMTNHHWAFSISALQAQCGFDRLRVLNDFTALALALPHLPAESLRQVGGGQAVPQAAIGLIGPGTGLGVSGLVPDGRGGWSPLEGEGGHVTLAGRTPREHGVLQWLDARYGHASGERAVCGQGLVDVHLALQSMDAPQQPAQPRTAAQIVQGALEQGDAQCREAVDLLCAFLGTAAGNLALTLGARGGVYIGGGIVPRLGAAFAQSPFRARFEDKGRFKDYLAAIPVFVIDADPSPALLGAASALDGAPL